MEEVIEEYSKYDLIKLGVTNYNLLCNFNLVILKNTKEIKFIFNCELEDKILGKVITINIKELGILDYNIYIKPFVEHINITLDKHKDELYKFNKILIKKELENNLKEKEEIKKKIKI